MLCCLGDEDTSEEETPKYRVWGRRLSNGICRGQMGFCMM